MAEETVVIKKEDEPVQPTIAESQLQMAVTFGQMTEANRHLMEKIIETSNEVKTMYQMMQEQSQVIQNLRSQTDITSRQTEELKESQTDIISTIKTDSEKEDKETLNITPPMETKIEIEQKPAGMKRSIFQQIFY